MNSDTQNAVNAILENGYYEQSQTLGAGGWPYLHAHGIDNWRKYILEDLSTGEEFSITARDDKAAIKAFSEMFHLKMMDYEIVEVITTYRTIAEGEKES